MAEAMSDGRLAELRALLHHEVAGLRLTVDEGRELLAEADRARAVLACVSALHNDGGRRWVGFPRADRQEAYCTLDQEAAPCSTMRALAGDEGAGRG